MPAPVPYNTFVSQIVDQLPKYEAAGEVYVGQVRVAREAAINFLLASKTPGIVASQSNEEQQRLILRDAYINAGYGDHEMTTSQRAKNDMEIMSAAIDKLLGKSQGVAVGAA